MELKQYVQPLIKWWWLLAAATLLSAVTAFLVKQDEPLQYRAKSTVIIGQAIDNPNPSGGEFFLSEQLADTYVNIASRRPVRDGAKEALGLNWLPPYSVRAVPNTQLIEITATDTHPQRTMAVANALADQLVAQSPASQQGQEQEQQAFIEQQLEELKVAIEETGALLDLKHSQLLTLVSASQIADAQAEITALEIKMRNLQTTFGALLSNTEEGSLNSIRVIEYAERPQVPINSGMAVTVVVAAAMGFSLAAGAAFLLEYLDDTVKSPDEIERLTGLPTLVGLSLLPDSSQSVLVTRKEPRSVISESFRNLRTGIQFATIDSKKRVILITSASPGEGKSSIASNLAIVMAQAGFNTIIIDADLRRPSIHRIFGVENYTGLTTTLLELDGNSTDAEIFESVKPSLTAEEKLAVMSSGALPPNPSELLGSDKMSRLVGVLRDHYDVVIIDSPPTLVVTDALVLSALVDGILLVAAFGSTRRAQLTQMVTNLRGINARILGVAINKITGRGEGYYYYHHYQQDDYYSAGSGKKGGRGGLAKRLLGRRQQQRQNKGPARHEAPAP